MSLVMEEIQEALLELSRQEDDDVDLRRCWQNSSSVPDEYLAH